MNKLPSSTIMTRLCWGVFFLILLFLGFQVVPRALGQRNVTKRSMAVDKPQLRPLSSLAGGAQVAPRSAGSIDASQLPYDIRRPSGPCQFQVLIVYADSEGLPTGLQSEILAEPGVTAVDLFDALVGTPTLGQLQQYDIVVPFSNSPFLDGVTLGNNLADYVDGGGIVVQYGFSHYGPAQPYGVNGRWLTGNYNPYSYSTNLLANTPFTLGTFNAGHPLMAGVTTLNSNFQNIVTLAAGATEVAAASNSNSLVAYRPVSGGHTTVGVTAYVGAASAQSGHWGRVVVNAGNWLLTCGPTPTPTPTATPTPTPVPTQTPFPRPTPGPSGTPRGTPPPRP